MANDQSSLIIIESLESFKQIFLKIAMTLRTSNLVNTRLLRSISLQPILKYVLFKFKNILLKKFTDTTVKETRPIWERKVDGKIMGHFIITRSHSRQRPHPKRWHRVALHPSAMHRHAKRIDRSTDIIQALFFLFPVRNNKHTDRPWMDLSAILHASCDASPWRFGPTRFVARITTYFASNRVMTPLIPA